MKSALLGALLAAAAALAACESSEVKAPAEGEEHEAEQEEDSDSAPFMIVVEHKSGRRCGASLVSLRTALTSAWCASGEAGAAPAELWALAPGASAARRVARVALAAGAEAVRADDAWSGAAMDLALLELEAPFGGGAGTRPILMATQPSECSAGATCHVVRALGRTPRLRIVDATLVAGDECAARWAGWPGLRESALCLVGATLCSSDWGTGVVCDGKLCGVLGQSARAPDASSPAAADLPDASCGDTHVAQSVARRRRFLHCAHTLRVCGRGGDCGQLCSERRLLDTGGAGGADGAEGAEGAGGADGADGLSTRQATVAVSEEVDETTTVTETTTMAQRRTSLRTSVSPTYAQSVPRPVRLSSVKPTRSRVPPVSTTTTPTTPQSPQSSPRPAFEFEPNRPDFKAGEYGDNAAEYGGEEPLLPTSSTEATSASPSPAPAAPDAAGDTAARRDNAAPRAPGAPRATPGAPDAAAIHAADLRAKKRLPKLPKKKNRSCAFPRPALSAYLLYVLVVITNLAN